MALRFAPVDWVVFPSAIRGGDPIALGCGYKALTLERFKIIVSEDCARDTLGWA